MSAMGHKQMFRPARSTSALPLKADIKFAASKVRFGPISDIASKGSGATKDAVLRPV